MRCEAVLRAKLAHIAAKERHGCNAAPAGPGQFLTPLLHHHDGELGAARRQLVKHRANEGEAIAGISEQGHDAQAAYLLLVVEPVPVLRLAPRVHQILLFPEMHGGDPHAHTVGRFSYPERVRLLCVVCGARLCSQGPNGQECLLDLASFAAELGVALVDCRQRRGKVAAMKGLHERRRALPAVTGDQALHRLESSQVLWAEEAIAAQAPLCLWDQAMRLVIADLLDADASGQGEITGSQSITNS